jgi:hypothetical protein
LMCLLSTLYYNFSIFPFLSPVRFLLLSIYRINW